MDDLLVALGENIVLMLLVQGIHDEAVLDCINIKIIMIASLIKCDVCVWKSLSSDSLVFAQLCVFSAFSCEPLVSREVRMVHDAITSYYYGM